ncbi:MAG: hypothetical protein NZ108_00370 [Bacteroidia bacterium]|nr:hypothetical protein [Bacteroidia bacterium]
MRPNQGFSQKEMVFLGHSQNGNQLNINYKIPYDGMIEIKFIHSDSKKTVWRNQYIRQLGERKETIDVSKFATKKPGNYQYLLCYKGKCLEKRINLP